MPEPTRASIEIRNNDDGTLDEVIIRVGDVVVFHLEQMTGKTWWMGCYEANKEAGLMVYLSAKSKIMASVVDDRPKKAARIVEVEVINGSGK